MRGKTDMLWGGPPGPRGSPRTRFRHWNRFNKGDQGVACGPGDPPHKGIGIEA
jgi:hypothetical protein